jgi:spermidine/putrescine transport system ATP-binding protein
MRRFGDVEAVASITLQIRKGEFFSLLGPSGCGKTTFLRLIAGLEVPDAGTLKIGGTDASRLPAHRRPVNTVFQSYALFPHMTVRENVAFGLKMKKTPRAELNKRVDEIMQLVEVSELAERRPAQLSGGEKQRVALARAVVNEPEVLLLDEPLGALDLKLRKQLQLELQQLQRRLGITFIYVTHDQEEALVMSDRIAVMHAGRLEQVDTGQRLYERPRTRFVARFLGSCNLIEATVRRCVTPSLPGSDAGPTANGFLEVEAGPGLLVATLPGDFPRPSVGQEVTLALRPEKIALALAETGPRARNVVEARIENLVYSGAETTYHLRAGAWQFKAVALNSHAGTPGFEIGENVSCHFGENALVPLED